MEKYKGRPDLAKKLKSLMWEDGLPVREAAEMLDISYRSANILCDYYGIETRPGFDYTVVRRVYSRHLIDKIGRLLSDGVPIKKIAKDLSINKEYPTVVKWLFQDDLAKSKEARLTSPYGIRTPSGLRNDVMFDDLIRICKMTDDGESSYSISKFLRFSETTVKVYQRIYRENGFDGFYIDKNNKVWKTRESYDRWRESVTKPTVKTEAPHFYKPMVLEAISYWNKIGGPHAKYWQDQLDQINKNVVPDVASNTTQTEEEQWTKAVRRLQRLSTQSRNHNTGRRIDTNL